MRGREEGRWGLSIWSWALRLAWWRSQLEAGGQAGQQWTALHALGRGVHSQASPSGGKICRVVAGPTATKKGSRGLRGMGRCSVRGQSQGLGAP